MLNNCLNSLTEGDKAKEPKGEGENELTEGRKKVDELNERRKSR